ncbi:MAG: hypothetical protein ABS46_00940 [Cytophagaceae bacterium SCN 52-12]|nr:MAG: hypothetical protein ABS46_00940 [Cytophagaceae bacterium SCN 52-12]
MVRCILASCLDLGIDEVYYFTYAVQPDWNHFDHPPMVGWLIRCATLDLLLTGELFIRLPAIAGAAIGTVLIYHCACLIAGKKAGLTAAILYNTSFYFGIISGLFILPDSVQLIFWLGALYLMIRFTMAAPGKERNLLLLGIGILIGLSILSKVHGLFLWIGFLGFLVFHQPGILKSAYLYAAIFLAALIASPIVFWNIQHDFITWRFHGERVIPGKFAIDWFSFVRTSLGQVLYANPVHFVVYLAGIKMALTCDARKPRQAYIDLLLWCSLPIISCTTFLSLLRDTLPHWSGPGFSGLLLVSVGVMYRYGRASHLNFLEKAVKGSAVVTVVGVGIAFFTVLYFPGTFGSGAFQDRGRGDFTLDIHGWKALRHGFTHIREEDVRTKRIDANAPLVIHKWFPGAHLYYYVAYPLDIPLIGMGALKDLHKFHWFNSRYDGLQPGDDAYFISPSNDFTSPYQVYGDRFDKIEHAGIIPQYRNGQVARYWQVYRLKGYKRETVVVP